MKKLLALGLIAISTTVLAGPLAERREARQDQRIQQGIQNGSITQQEANRLQRGQTHVDNLESKVASDGTVTKKEAAHVSHAQNVQNRHIEHARHDRQHDFNHDGRGDRHERREHRRDR